MTTTETLPLRKSAPTTQTRFLILDTESVPDGKLLSKVRHPAENLTPDEAVERAREEARAKSANGSDFIPVTFQYPIAVAIVRVDNNFELEAITCLDAPLYRPVEIAKKFWQGVSYYNKAKLVTFNGRAFDLPLLEMAAFRHGCNAMNYFQSSRNRFGGNHLDLLDWMTNFGACRLAGGLDLLSKMLGKPGKMGIQGDQVYDLWRAGKVKEINDYCLCDALDTYFVFLRTRRMTGDLTADQEEGLLEKAKAWLTEKTREIPALEEYVEKWVTWEAWP